MSAVQVAVGSWLPLSVTMKVQSAELFPLASVAWQVTVVVPFGKVEPLGGVQVEIGRASCRERVEISVCAVSLKKKGAGVVVMLGRQVTVDAWLSLTVT